MKQYINYELLLKAAQWGVDNPEHFTMTKFKMDINRHNKSYVTRDSKLTCGTAGCLAANTIIVGKSFAEFKRTLYDDIKHKASEMLGLTRQDEMYLFYGDSYYYKDLPLIAGTPAYAKAVLKGVKAFIKDHKAGKIVKVKEKV